MTRHQPSEDPDLSSLFEADDHDSKEGPDLSYLFSLVSEKPSPNIQEVNHEEMRLGLIFKGEPEVVDQSSKLNKAKRIFVLDQEQIKRFSKLD